MGDVANCKLGYFTQWNDAEHSTADNASSVPYYLQCHITRTYPIINPYVVTLCPIILQGFFDLYKKEMTFLTYAASFKPICMYGKQRPIAILWYQ